MATSVIGFVDEVLRAASLGMRLSSQSSSSAEATGHESGLDFPLVPRTTWGLRSRFRCLTRGGDTVPEWKLKATHAEAEPAMLHVEVKRPILFGAASQGAKEVGRPRRPSLARWDDSFSTASRRAEALGSRSASGR